jgi:hypothetical protein
LKFFFASLSELAARTSIEPLLIVVPTRQPRLLAAFADAPNAFKLKILWCCMIDPPVMLQANVVRLRKLVIIAMGKTVKK